MFIFLLVVQALVAAALVGVILMQRSEGGGLGMGGSPSGLMSARGAADFLTRATTILASLFVILSITLAAVASMRHSVREIDTTLAKQPAPVGTAAPAAAPDPLAAAADQAAQTGEQAPAQPAPAPAK